MSPITTTSSTVLRSRKTDAITTRLKSTFFKAFDGNPSLYFAPGRINLLGEHVDYNDGIVLPMAINKGMYFIIAPSENDTIHLIAKDFNEEYTGKLGELVATSSWLNYCVGIIELLDLKQGFNCVFGGDIPIGAGLSSSAALCTGLAYALNNTFKLGKTPMELALIAQQTEHQYANVKCGLMDQIATVFSKKDHITQFDCYTQKIEHLPTNFGNYNIVLFDTGVKHELSDSEYNTRRKECETALKKIQQKLPTTASFREVSSRTIERLKADFTEKEYLRINYVLSEIERVTLAKQLLADGDLYNFGQLMYASHEGLRDKYNVSCSELDFIVTQAQQTKHIIGARMMGGGFGGCVIALIEQQNKQEIMDNISKLYLHQFKKTLKTYEVHSSNGVSNLAI